MADGTLEITDEQRKKAEALAKELTAKRAAETAGAPAASPTATPTSVEAAAAAAPTTPTTPTTPTYDTGGLGTPDLSAAKSYFSQDASTPTAPQKTGPVTPGLDRLAAMQGSPMGSASVLGQKRSLESETGKAFRMARKLQRMGFEGAADRVALGAAATGLNEPKIKSQEFRGLEAKQQAAATTEAEAAEEYRRKQLEFQSKLLEAQNKALSSGQFDFSQFGDREMKKA